MLGQGINIGVCMKLGRKFVSLRRLCIETLYIRNLLKIVTLLKMRHVRGANKHMKVHICSIFECTRVTKLWEKYGRAEMSNWESIL